MPKASCLYRRPSGIYAVRLVVPKRLREWIGRTEIHSSTGLRNLDEAKSVALKIQLEWRDRVLAMDIDKLLTAAPFLAGEALIGLVEAANITGIPVRVLAAELAHDRASVHIHIHGLRCWKVPDLYDIDRDPDGTYVLNDVEHKGDETLVSGLVRLYDGRSSLMQFATGTVARESIFRDGKTTAYFIDHELNVESAQCLIEKRTVGVVRDRLVAAAPLIASRATAAPALPMSGSLVPIERAPKPVVSVAVADGPAVYDPVTAKHGNKRFSELYALCKRDRNWAADQTRRMDTEAGLFIDLMDDPKLADIEKETVLEFARLLAAVPSDIYRARRRFKTTSIDELIAIAERHELARKAETTVKNHVGRLSEILGYGVRSGMMRFNPASDFKRGRVIGQRSQDERQVFTPEELSRIFSQDWFTTGSGSITKRGWTHWRPYYYWLPLLGLLTGGRINELAQLHLDDLRASEKGVWYVDFNLTGADKMDEPDKSLKTVNAVRVVPMHAKLVQLGLPEYASALRRAGYSRLFPELKHDAVKGYGKPAGSWFNERFLGGKLGIERNGMKTFHSFRHCFSTAVERLDVGERVLAQLVGHERGKTQGMARYAKDRSADDLAPIVNRLLFSQLDELAPFNADAALSAIKCAMLQKHSAERRK